MARKSKLDAEDRREGPEPKGGKPDAEDLREGSEPKARVRKLVKKTVKRK